jgi:hypothetical protein
MGSKGDEVFNHEFQEELSELTKRKEQGGVKRSSDDYPKADISQIKRNVELSKLTREMEKEFGKRPS